MSSEADLQALYPFLHGKPQEPEKLDAALLHSIEEKARDSRETNARFFAAQAPIVVAAAKSVADVYRRGGRLFSMGNGGSSCDASHVAVEFVHPITAGRPALAATNLVADIAMISAVGNDVGFEQVNEIAEASQVAIEIREKATPIREEVKAFCEILGLDPLYLANEGKIVVIAPADEAEAALAAIRAHPLGEWAAIVGRIQTGEPGRVTMQTIFGGRRIVDMLVGEQLPRIC